MPEAWAKLLSKSGISDIERKKNPQAVVKALEFLTNQSGIQEGEAKFMTAQRYDGEWGSETGSVVKGVWWGVGGEWGDR